MPREAGLPNQKRMDPLLQTWDDSAHDRGDRAACDGRQDIFTDYNSPFDDHDEAKKICDACPIFGICDSYAKEVKPGWGFWAGRVWVSGKTRKLRTIYEQENDGGEQRESEFRSVG